MRTKQNGEQGRRAHSARYAEGANVVCSESAYPPRSGWLAGLCRLKDGD